MKFFTLLSIVSTILAAPANVLVVTKVHTVTVVGANNGYTTLDLPEFLSHDETATVSEASEPTNEVNSIIPTTSETPLTQAATTQAATTQAATTQATTATSTAPTSTSSASTETGNFSGDATYFDVGLGACGQTNTNSDYIVAISNELYAETDIDGNSNHNPVCGKKLKINYNGKSVEATVADSCPECAKYSLDLSPSTFEKIADKDLGRVKMTWEWI